MVFFKFLLLILVETIVINIYFKNLFEFFVSDKQSSRNHGYRGALYFSHAFVIIAVEDLFYDMKPSKNVKDTQDV